jgi:hypothetical protein
MVKAIAKKSCLLAMFTGLTGRGEGGGAGQVFTNPV